MADAGGAGAGDFVAGAGRLAARRPKSAALLQRDTGLYREDGDGGCMPEHRQLAGENGARSRFSVALLGATAGADVFHGVDDGFHVEKTLQWLHVDRAVMHSPK